jgi:hypothetical protein
VSRSLIVGRIVWALCALAVFVAVWLVPAPWRPDRTIHGIVVSAEFGRAGRWTGGGGSAQLKVKLADGTMVDCSADLAVLPRAGDVILLRQRLGLFGQTLLVTPIPDGR